MNQFKKAKQKQLASGRPIESISDLQTAGVKKEEQKKDTAEEIIEEQKKNEPISVKDEKEIEIISSNQTDNTADEEIKTEEALVETVPEKITADENSLVNKEVITNIENEPDKNTNENINSNEKVMVLEVTEDKFQNLQAETNNESVNELHTNNNIMNNIVVTGETDKNETSIIEETINLKEEVVVALPGNNVASPHITENINVSANSINTVTENNLSEHSISAKGVTKAPIINHAAPQFDAPQYVIQAPVMTPVNTQTINEHMIQQPMNITPVTQGAVLNNNVTAINNSQIYPEEYPVYTEAIVQKQTASKAAKKNIPNIFAPKGEAKSMRKSLVLKPTSVKIAENYCAKNGGSFNELIQTLLDNFIDEYGL